MKYNGGNMSPLLVPTISFLGFLAFVAVSLTLVVLLIDRAFGTRIIGRVQSRTVGFADSAVFVSTLVATLASLALSEVLRFPPCVLCWYQRIFMYVQVPLTYLALARRELSLLKPYLVVLNAAGSIVALYHYSLHVLPRTVVAIAPCSNSVGGVPCDRGYDMYFGFMTFPLMAAAVFAFNILLLTVYNQKPANQPVAKPAASRKKILKNTKPRARA